MAIKIQAKHIRIKVKDEYHLFVGQKLEKVADLLNIESKDENMVLVSNKKINSKGNK
ncbi:hypothetical protein [Tenacibaculum maritimum]|uniref:hypothetical protein n=1 Tax=Tenacibaculum maritimum TaxID=107401 RepID=UPI001330C632|nr:hypothetical protein [Tenacibaculum maritimum]MCD9564277.1 hypothetical protein [Tenacibaculum maritimum]MCD9567093.1 hypothetical protein [Tenacibaculum maritimum]MCD9580308.1 hypothetical protein [Tenacibaculum maritimum]MCD9598068.1 hypothetical protein [Tenacibaculum maritimum]MCD9614979.1 hypothetical protein [Tenacibaculum maritimum]